ncbi:MAG: hypothetical protein J6U64_00005, partial [Alphaproteobacteria bacterium]|nr:hypothetical protein [Alphaproteobacteria bacterium]
CNKVDGAEACCPSCPTEEYCHDVEGKCRVLNETTGCYECKDTYCGGTGEEQVCCSSGEVCANLGAKVCCPAETPTAYQPTEDTWACCTEKDVCNHACCGANEVCAKSEASKCCPTEAPVAYEKEPAVWECCTEEKSCGVTCCGAEESCADNEQSKCCPTGDGVYYVDGVATCCPASAQSCAVGNFVFEPEICDCVCSLKPDDCLNTPETPDFDEEGCRCYNACEEAGGTVCGNICCGVDGVPGVCRSEEYSLCCDNDVGAMYEGTNGTGWQCCPEKRPEVKLSKDEKEMVCCPKGTGDAYQKTDGSYDCCSALTPEAYLRNNNTWGCCKEGKVCGANCCGNNYDCQSEQYSLCCPQGNTWYMKDGVAKCCAPKTCDPETERFNPDICDCECILSDEICAQKGDNYHFDRTTCACACNNDMCGDGTVCCPNSDPYCVENLDKTENMCCQNESDWKVVKDGVETCCTEALKKACNEQENHTFNDAMCECECTYATCGGNCCPENWSCNEGTVTCCENNPTELECHDKGLCHGLNTETGCYECRDVHCGGTGDEQVCCTNGTFCRDKTTGLCCGNNVGEVYTDANGQQQCCPVSATDAVTAVDGTPTCCPVGAGEAYPKRDEQGNIVYDCCSGATPKAYQDAEKNWQCCVEEQICKDTCCPTGMWCAKEKVSKCCPIDTVAYQDATGAWQCCAEENICGTSCCASNETCSNEPAGKCCPNDAPVAYRDADNVWQCCTEGSVCGNVCCGSGQTCSNPLANKCCPKDAPVAYRDAENVWQCCTDEDAVCGNVCCGSGQHLFASFFAHICPLPQQ